MPNKYKRGELYLADLNDGVGSEQRGRRPVVIVQNNLGNKHSATVIVAAISSKVGVKAKLPTHLYIGMGYGLDTPSIVLLEQLRTIDKQRLEQRVGKLPKKLIRDVDRALAISVGLAKTQHSKSNDRAYRSRHIRPP